MATLFRRAIDQVVDPVVITRAQLPVARVGRAYAASFTAQDDGVPRHDGTINVVVSAADSTGLAVTLPVTLKIAPFG
jgi:hypothetical protein